MIDTIKLTLDNTMISILDKDRFEKGMFNSGRGYFTMVQNPVKKELLSGIYKPRLTLTNRFNCSGRFGQALSIEFSIPKLIYGNNFDELEDGQFPEVIQKLSMVLASMGVRIFTKMLESAPVSLVHYSKNIPLTDGTTPHYLISKIQQADVALPLDVTQTDYSNDGYGYKWHANRFELAFYDKIHDCEKAKVSDKRAIENDSAIQLSLLDSLEKRKMFEVLRMEARLNQRQKIKQVLQKIGVVSDLTFQSLFKSAISQKVLLSYLDEIEGKRPAVLDLKARDPKDVLVSLIIHNPSLGPLKILQALGLKIAMGATNPRELRAMFGKSKPRSWYRLMCGARQIKTPTAESPFRVVQNCLTNYKPMRLLDFQDRMINNDKYN